MSRRGKQAMADGKYEEAIAIFSDLVRALPEEPALRMNLGIACFMAGRHERAVAELERATRRRPPSGPALFFLGAAYLKTGRPDRAVAPLEEIVAAEPKNARALHMLADALFASRRYERAADRFLALTRVDAHNPKAWHGLGQSYEALAARSFEELRERHGDSPYVSLLRAQALLQQKRYTRAFGLYLDALAALPDDRGIHEDLATIYRETGHPEWADRLESKASRLPRPDCAVASPECLFRAGRYLEVVAAVGAERSPVALYWVSRAYGRLATAAFARLADLPPSAELHRVLAEAYRAQGRAREAADEWRQALRYEPTDPTLKKGLAESLHLAREFEAARDILRELLTSQPASAELHLLYGATLLELHEPDEAIAALRQAVERDPALPGARALLGRAYLTSGQPQRAIPHLRAALGSDDDGQVHFQLATAYRATGEPALAASMLERYKQILAALEAARQEEQRKLRITPPR